MADTPGSLSPFGSRAGSRLATEVAVQAWPFQCATFVPPKAQMLAADRAEPPCRPPSPGTWVQMWPLKCQVPRTPPGWKPSPNTQTFVLLMTVAPEISRENDPATDQ